MVMDKAATNKPAYVLLAIIFLYSACVFYVFPKWTVDDAYITFRYADNLAHHGELAWNVGEPPVEGYTGLFLPLLLTGGILVGLPPTVLSKVIGVAALFLTALMLWLVARFLKLPPLLNVALVALYLTVPAGFPHALSGLETTLFSAGLVVSAFLLLRALSTPEMNARRESWALFSLFIVSLIRPEGIAMATCGALVLVVANWRRAGGLPWRTVSRIVVFLAAPYALYLGWRLYYYDSWLPNTFYAKLADEGSGTILRTAVGFWHLYVAIPLLAFVAYAGSRLVSGRILRRFASADSAVVWTTVAILLFAAAVLFQYAHAVPMMNYSFRFIYHYYPLGLVLAALLVSAVGGLLQIHSRARRLICGSLVALAVLAAATQVGRNVKNLGSTIVQYTKERRLLQDEHIPAGRFVHDAVPPDEWMVVHLDAGAIPYYAGLRTVDFGCLNDRTLARGRLSLAQQVDYFYAHNPGVLVFTSHYADSVAHGPQAAAIVADPRFANYEKVRIFRSDSHPNYYELVFLRLDLARGNEPATHQ